MIKPVELESPDGNTLTASPAGELPALGRLIDRYLPLGGAEYWYTPAIHFAARDGQVEAVSNLLDPYS